MHHCLYGLTSHPDVTRFEIEDGVLRQAAVELLSKETTIDTITIDLGVRVRQGAPENLVSTFDSMVWISGATETDVSPPNLADLIAEVAVVGATSPLDVEEVSQLEKPWIGTTTPGPKVTAHVNPTAADSPGYRNSIAELADDIVKSLGDVGCRIIFGERSNTWPVSTSISFWFPNNAAAKDAIDTNAFASLASSNLIQSESFILVEATEHRVVPNPNTWGSSSTIEPPAAE